MTDKRMSEERLEELLKTAYDSEFYAMDISECAREIKALKAELTAARTAFNAETAQQILAVHVQRANEAEAKLASARADALEDAAKLADREVDRWQGFDSDREGGFRAHAKAIRALKPVQGEQ